MQSHARLLNVAIALVLASLLAGAGTLTMAYFPPAELEKPREVMIRAVFVSFLSDMSEPVLFQQPDVDYAVRVTVHTPRGSVLFHRIARKSDGGVTSTVRRFGFTDLGAPVSRTDTQTSVTAAAFKQLADEIQRQAFFSIASSSTVMIGQGPVCLIEVFDGRNYHSAFQPLCAPDTPFGAIAAKAAALANVDYFAQN